VSAVLHIQGLRKSYGEVVALNGVDLDVAAGEITSLLGPNGAGKTTIVSIVAGLRRADAGVVEVGGLDALARRSEVRRQIGLAPQDLGVYPVVSVRQNLQLFGRLAGLGERELRARIDEVARALDITELLNREGGALSGGVAPLAVSAAGIALLLAFGRLGLVGQHADSLEPGKRQSRPHPRRTRRAHHRPGGKP